jgi:hypothetical protein
MSETRSVRKRAKELKVLELHRQGFSYRKIASEVHLSLREVSKYVQTISNKRKSSTTSLMDEVVLEYRISGMKHELRDLKIEKDNLINEVNNLRAQKYNLQIQVRARQSELNVVKVELENERFSKEVLEIFNESNIRNQLGRTQDSSI